jgi:hypothetical protein
MTDIDRTLHVLSVYTRAGLMQHGCGDIAPLAYRLIAENEDGEELFDFAVDAMSLYRFVEGTPPCVLRLFGASDEGADIAALGEALWRCGAQLH